MASLMEAIQYAEIHRDDIHIEEALKQAEEYNSKHLISKEIYTIITTYINNLKGN